MTSSPFEGEKVVLRPFESDDAQTLREYLNHPSLWGRRYLPWGMPDVGPFTESQVQSVLERWSGEERGLVLAVEAQVRKQRMGLGSDASGVSTLIGHADMSWDWDPHCPSMAIVIAPDHQRKGYGSDALRVVLRFLFDYTPAHNVGCWIAEWNEAGLGFVRHHGFRENGRTRRAGMRQGKPFDVLVTDILRPEWQAAQDAAPVTDPAQPADEGGPHAARG